MSRVVKKKHVIASQRARWRTPGWPLLPRWGNSPSGNPPVEGYLFHCTAVNAASLYQEIATSLRSSQ